MAQAREGPVIVWFRRDLRLSDNPALTAAIESGRPVVPLYVHDDRLESRPLGAAAQWWLHGSLRALAADLASRGAPLVLRRGPVETVLPAVAAETGAGAVHVNRLGEAGAAARDRALGQALQAQGVACRGFDAGWLVRPGALLNGSGEPYRVFTPFMKALWARAQPPGSLAAPARLRGASAALPSEALEDWRLRPTAPDWATGFSDWRPGEAGAAARLEAFVEAGLADYAGDRDRPDREGSSRLSPHLRFGEISPWRIVQAARAAAERGESGHAAAERFAAELAWREFSAHLLHARPDLAARNVRAEFDAFPWRRAPEALAAWRRGRTGYPLVDAGLRQLWTTGWMHNRVRMVAASFLVKHLLVDWREGEAWFWDTLVDADPASNAQNWQWVAGSGADASPWFRIFNPVAQGERFDPDGAYVRRWVPELAALPARFIHQPWTAPAEVLNAAGVRLGATYPRPIVEHVAARQRALDALAASRRAA